MRFVFDGVAAKNKDVINTEELQIDQCILRFFFRKTSAYDVWNRICLIAVDERRTNPNGSGPFFDRFFVP